jgi:hypothetical protein
MPQKDMLPQEVRDLWTAYEVAESRCPRHEKLTRLNSFVSRLLALPVERWSDWALSVACEYSDGNKQFEIRMPLFRAAIFPALKQAIENRVPGAARSLAALSQHLYRAKDCQSQLPPEQQTQIGLLLAALDHDPNDDQSRRKLIDALAWQLDYAIHEIPSGVLYGHDGATIEQCGELQAELDTFCRLMENTDLGDRYRSLIDECRFHFYHYPVYLADTAKFRSYAAYLDSVDAK